MCTARSGRSSGFIGAHVCYSSDDVAQCRTGEREKLVYSRGVVSISGASAPRIYHAHRIVFSSLCRCVFTLCSTG